MVLWGGSFKLNTAAPTGGQPLGLEQETFSGKLLEDWATGCKKDGSTLRATSFPGWAQSRDWSHNGLSQVMGCVPSRKKDMLKFSSPVPQNVTTFESRVVIEVITFQ